MAKDKGITAPRNRPYSDEEKFGMEDYAPITSVEYGERDADTANVDMEERAREVLQRKPKKEVWDATVHGYHKVK